MGLASGRWINDSVPRGVDSRVTVHRFRESDTVSPAKQLSYTELLATFVYNWLLTLGDNGSFSEAVNGYIPATRSCFSSEAVSEMFCRCCSWLTRKKAARKPRRRPSVPLRLEPLEDRLALAALTSPVLPAQPIANVPLFSNAGTSSFLGLRDNPTQDSQALSRSLLLAVAVRRHRVDHGEVLHDNPDNHPFLAMLAAHVAQLNVSLSFSPDPPNTLTGDLSSLKPSPQQAIASTFPLPLSYQPANAAINYSASVFIVSPPGKPAASSDTLPLPADPPPLIALPPSPQPSANDDGPSAFELSPLGPLGFGIVPVPVPRGFEEGLTDDFGQSAPTPAPADQLLSASNAGDAEAVRDAVLQLLHDSAPMTVVQGLPSLTAEQAADAPASDGTIVAGTPLDLGPDAAGDSPLTDFGISSIIAVIESLLPINNG
jgi:hypothetical protein